jgi:hypothetical protein
MASKGKHLTGTGTTGRSLGRHGRSIDVRVGLRGQSAQNRSGLEASGRQRTEACRTSWNLRGAAARPAGRGSSGVGQTEISFGQQDAPLDATDGVFVLEGAFVGAGPPAALERLHRGRVWTVAAKTSQMPSEGASLCLDFTTKLTAQQQSGPSCCLDTLPSTPNPRKNRSNMGRLASACCAFLAHQSSEAHT